MSYFVKYKTATMVSRIDNSLAGSFMYFADPQDAFDTGLFCEKVVVYVDDFFPENRIDIFGKYFKVASEAEIRKQLNKNKR